ncbi:MAG TPA: DUF2298 domain-containing protein [Anaerolineaceae bacterium]|nr:DUF2298 domain-containing protein [Anaerolineaceae bacterium]HPN50201.1 DUF2298 domain-containing protein [Anaerolineaceae bacterium]
MITIIFWYLAALLVGWLAFPIAFCFLGGLKDRGYALARPLGLLLWGYLFWLMGSLKIAQNDAGGVLLALAILGLFSYLASRDRWDEMRTWVRENQRLIITAELVILAAFAFLIWHRALDPAINGTERPMEFAFINAILRSPSMPPNDPWLSGYAISYYYFGYVMVSMLIRVTGAAPEIGFNLSLALWYAMAAGGAYSLVYNLIHARKTPLFSNRPGLRLAAPILGAVMVLLVSNMGGVLEKLHASGLFWEKTSDGAVVSNFWKWLDIREWDQAPPEPYTALWDWSTPQRSGILFWRSSRVIQDRDYANGEREIIDEFPFFSYLLGDLHPHVLSMPFVMLAIALILNFYLNGGGVPFKVVEGWSIPFNLPYLLLSVVTLGGLAFLNTWDFPIYLGLFAAAYFIRQYQEEGWRRDRLLDLVFLGLLLGVGGALAYLPFYTGFSSQAGGPMPSLIYSTRGIQFWVMFAPLLLPLILFLFYEIRKEKAGRQVWFGLLLAVILMVSLLVVSYALGYVYSQFSSSVNGYSNLNILFLQDVQGAAVQDPAQTGAVFAGLVGESLYRRITSPGTWLTLGLMLVLVTAVLRQRGSEKEDAEGHTRPDFALLLALLGIGLTLVPEFIYLRDQFGWRMNTIFKFYYQAWIVWAVAAAYGALVLLSEAKPRGQIVASVALVVSLMCGLIYPLVMTGYKVGNDLNRILTLDGLDFFKQGYADDAGAAEWLKTAPAGVVAEAVGNSYQFPYGRMSTVSGLPTVLGWVGHESQWRGGTQEMGTRYEDIATLYKTRDSFEAENLLRMYNIRYIVLGNLERSTYLGGSLNSASETKFQKIAQPVFQNSSITIYEYAQPVTR